MTKGSVLLEALIAVVIMAVTLVVIMQGMANNVRIARVHQEYSRALLLLQDKLDEVFFLNPGDVSGVQTSGGEPPTGVYQVQTALTGARGPAEGLRQLDLTVRWPSGSSSRSLALRTWLVDNHVE